jgi:hypothetical protein
VKANVFAKELLYIDRNNRNARYIVAVASKDRNINDLKELEKSFRDNHGLNNANNLCIVISDRERGFKNKIKWLDRIINGKDDQYNKIRAITKKGLILIENDIGLNFSIQEISLLHTSYFYNFSQKISSAFNKTHKVLWEFYSQKKNHMVLFFLFKQSSLFWRVYEELNQEQFYSLKLLDLINDPLPSTIDLSKHKYVTLRVRILSDK